MYLESLKTYELFAGGDSLFQRAAEKFHLLNQGGSQSLEGLKQRVLKVIKIRDTKILEIKVTLPDPKQAQSVAQYIAAETVNASRRESLASDQEFVEQAGKQLAEAQRRLGDLQQQWSKAAVSQPIESLQSEIDADVDLRSKVQQELVDAEAEAAAYAAPSVSNQEFAREQRQAADARAVLLGKRAQELDRTIAEKTKALAARTAARSALENELKVAQSEYQAVSARLRDSQTSAGTHAEQLRVIDPGIVPGRPRSPNIPLNVIAAVFAAFVSSVVYLSFEFVYRRRPVGFERPLTREMRA